MYKRQVFGYAGEWTIEDPVFEEMFWLRITTAADVDTSQKPDGNSAFARDIKTATEIVNFDFESKVREVFEYDCVRAVQLHSSKFDFSYQDCYTHNARETATKLVGDHVLLGNYRELITELVGCVADAVFNEIDYCQAACLDDMDLDGPDVWTCEEVHQENSDNLMRHLEVYIEDREDQIADMIDTLRDDLERWLSYDSRDDLGIWNGS